MLPIALLHAISMALKRSWRYTFLFFAWERSKEALHCGIDDSSKNDKAKIWSWNFRQNLKYRISYWLRVLRNSTKTKIDLSDLSEAHFSQTKRNHLKWFIDCISHLIKLLGAVFVYHGPILFLKAHFINECHLYWHFFRLILLFNPITNFETKHK